MNEVKAITAYVLRSTLGDCTNGGITATAERVLLVIDPSYLLDMPKTDLPVFLFRNADRYLSAVPVDHPGKGHTPYMMGGNFLWSSDSRFPADHPIPAHDRTETWAQSERLST